MAREHARIWLRIWSDDHFRALSPQAQHLYFVLLTSPSLTYAGVADWRPARIAANAAGWTADEVRVAGAELAQELFVVIDEASEEVLLRSFVRNDDILKNPNVAVSMVIAFGGIASRVLRGVVVHELVRLHADRPELKGWGPKVTELLDRVAIDPATYPLGVPVAEPVAEPVEKTVWQGAGYGVAQGVGLPVDSPIGQGVDYPVDYPLTEGLHTGVGYPVRQGVASLPAPAPAPATYPDGGRVTEVPHLATPTETNTPTPTDPDPEHPPAERCPEHLDAPTTAPCGPCGDARRARIAWDTQQDRRRADDAAIARQAAAADRAREIAACALCDATGYRGTTVCDHDPDTVERAKRGSALVRAALAAKRTDPTPDTVPEPEP